MMLDRPLWKLLLETAQPQTLAERPLTCSECFTILEYLVDNVAEEKGTAVRETLQAAVKQHLATCPDCRAYYQERLKKLEAYQARLRPSKKATSKPKAKPSSPKAASFSKRRAAGSTSSTTTSSGKTGGSV